MKNCYKNNINEITEGMINQNYYKFNITRIMKTWKDFKQWDHIYYSYSSQNIHEWFSKQYETIDNIVDNIQIINYVTFSQKLRLIEIATSQYRQATRLNDWNKIQKTRSKYSQEANTNRLNSTEWHELSL